MCGKKVLWSALGIGCVIDFLVLILAVLSWFLELILLTFQVLKRGP